MYELIIAEKPAASKKIAEALADGSVKKENFKGVPYYKVKHDGKEIIVGCAVGHLYGLAEKNKKGMKFPVFDIEWKPSYEVEKAHFSKKYFEALKKLSKDAGEFTVACDYDVEGEVIGMNIIRFIAKKKEANRMKFSTLTKNDLVTAYEHKSKHLDWQQGFAGETRHMLDWYYGINTSRALTSAFKSQSYFKIMSTGRVQGPALKIIVDREKEIMAFVPKKYWQIFLTAEKNGIIVAVHKEDKFWEKEKAKKVYDKTHKEKTGKITDIKKNEFDVNPPFPFDLTALQIEAYRCFGINPKETLSIGQELYTNGYISYPRTSSQILPKEIGYNNILNQLSKNPIYEKLAKELTKNKALVPNNGKKTDPAHPAIFPTGIKPAKIGERENKIYDLIVKRFLATFGEDARRESMNVDIDVNKEIFVASGTRTIKEGWFHYYMPYVAVKEEEMPKIAKGDSVVVKEIRMEEKETKPRNRYTQASIIKELEKRNLGTKATRAQIVDTLYQRGYVMDQSITPTELGFKLVEVLQKYSPKILDEEMTRHFEIEMDEIREGKKKEKEVLEEAKEVIEEISKKFKSKEEFIGSGLSEAYKISMDRQNTIGKCPACKDGILMMRRGKFGRFIACSKYPDCKTTFKLPSNGLVKNSEKLCEHCNYPMIMIIRRGKRPQEVCINASCPSKEIEKEMMKGVNDKIDKQCPKCKEGKILLRRSMYGSFLGCSNYPKCRYIERINNNKNKYDKKGKDSKSDKKSK